MATYTRPIPTLRGEDAKIFNKKADEALKNRKNAIVFDEHIIEMKKILKKANMMKYYGVLIR